MEPQPSSRLRFLKAPTSSAPSSSPSRGSSAASAESVASGLLPPVWTPRPGTLFKLLLAARLMSALFSGISDCDETYNYWEPTHYMIYGYGFQTWEYSPTYAIRSYAYVLLHALPIKLFQFILPNDKVAAFYGLRCLLALASAASETFMYKGIIRQYGRHVARLTAAMLLLSTGMYISATAYLPSSFAMHMSMLALGGWYSDNFKIAIAAVAVSTFLGWPFAAILGVPIAYDIVVRRKQLKFFLQCSVISGVVILAPIVAVDSYYFGKLVVAPLNIVLYNVLTNHGPNLYGTEPWTYYLANGFLNFNIVFFLALASIVVCQLVQWITCSKFPGIPHWLGLSPLYLWMLVFVSQPHKEERFLFPVYPHVCVCAAIAVDMLQRFIGWVYDELAMLSSRPAAQQAPNRQHYLRRWPALPAIIIAVYGTLCLSRIAALYTGYHAPLTVYGQFYSSANLTMTDSRQLRAGNLVSAGGRGATPDPPVICLGKEWHRFPSNFFVPSDRWRVKFLQSEFRGLLPGEYSTSHNGTRIIPKHMNDMNVEEPSRYVDLSRCNYIIDLDSWPGSPREPRYAVDVDQWEPVITASFLDSKRSHAVFRAFYVPYLTSRYCTYDEYNVLRRKLQ